MQAFDQGLVRPILILGTGPLALEIADLATDCGRYEVSAFVESWYRKKTGDTIEGRPVIWVDDAAPFASTHLAVCALGTPARRTFVEQIEGMGFEFPSIVHPTAHVSSRSSIGPGTVVFPGSVVGAYSTMGRHVLVNRGSLIGHHVTIDDYATLSPGVNIAGSTTIGEAALIGVGSIVLNNLAVGPRAVVAAGSTVTHDVSEGSVVAGSPARFARKAEEPSVA